MCVFARGGRREGGQGGGAKEAGEAEAIWPTRQPKQEHYSSECTHAIAINNGRRSFCNLIACFFFPSDSPVIINDPGAVSPLRSYYLTHNSLPFLAEGASGPCLCVFVWVGR